MSTLPTQYPFLREMLDDRFTDFADSDLDATFESAFGEGVTPGEYEEFFRGLSNAFSAVGPYVSSAGAGALRGASSGAAFGLPGLIGGALLGGTGSVLQSHGRGTARDIGGAIGGGVNIAGSLTGGGLGGRFGGQTGGAANQLLALLQRPETAQALAGMGRGQNQAVQLGRGGPAVPANAFAGLLGALGRQAEAEAYETGVPGYLLHTNGVPRVDVSDPDQRAARLLQLLAATDWDADSVYDDSEAYDDAWGFDDFDEYEELGEIEELDEFELVTP